MSPAGVDHVFGFPGCLRRVSFLAILLVTILSAPPLSSRAVIVTGLALPRFVLKRTKATGFRLAVGIYCAVCHGTKGDGNGILSQRDKFNGIPNYKDRDVTEGSIYHVIMYGRNLMRVNRGSGWCAGKPRFGVVAGKSRFGAVGASRILKIKDSIAKIL